MRPQPPRFPLALQPLPLGLLCPCPPAALPSCALALLALPSCALALLALPSCALALQMYLCGSLILQQYMKCDGIHTDWLTKEVFFKSISTLNLSQSETTV